VTVTILIVPFILDTSLFFSSFFLGKKATKSPVAAMLPPHSPDAGPLLRRPTAHYLELEDFKIKKLEDCIRQHGCIIDKNVWIQKKTLRRENHAHYF